MGDRDEKFKEICKMLWEFDPTKKNPFERERGCYLEDYSGVDKHLANVEKSLETYKGFLSTVGIKGDLNFLATLPLDDIAILMDKNSSYLQKKTAYKVMQRYFRNVQQSEFGQSVNFDQQLTTEVAVLKSSILKQQEYQKDTMTEMLSAEAKRKRLLEEIKDL